jgi:hypothetical protein
VLYAGLRPVKLDAVCDVMASSLNFDDAKLKQRARFRLNVLDNVKQLLLSWMVGRQEIEPGHKASYELSRGLLFGVRVIVFRDNCAIHPDGGCEPRN